MYIVLRGVGFFVTRAADLPRLGGCSHERLVSTAMHVLILLLDYSEPAGAAGGAAVAPNAVRDSLAAMKKKSDLAKVYNGFGRLLSNPHQVAEHNYAASVPASLPASRLLTLLTRRRPALFSRESAGDGHIPAELDEGDRLPG
eukprot:SAG11_NODE_1378_length_5084_cov_3.339619_4_plen_143_part_00